MNDRTEPRVVPLDRADGFRVAQGEPDVRGWEVVAADGRRIGDVDNLLIDTGAMRVRYLDVQVDRELLPGDGGRHVLVPIGHARLRRDDGRVLVDGLESADIGALPEYRSEPVTREYETTVRSRWDRGFTPIGRGVEDEFYDNLLYDDRRFYGSSTDNPLV